MIEPCPFDSFEAEENPFGESPLDCPFEADEAGPLWSFSRVDAWTKCPYHYWLRYERDPRLVEPDSKPAAFGRAVHSVINAALMKRGTPAQLAAHFAGQSPLLDDSEDVGEIASLASSFLDRFSPTGRFLTEERYVCTVAGVRFQAYLDLIEDLGHAVRITDFKTNWGTYAPTDKKQLPLYARVVEQVYRKPVIMRNYFLRYKRNAVHEEAATAAVLKDSEDWLGRQVAAIEAARQKGEGGFPATPGDCGLCGAGLACLGFEQRAVGTTKEAEKLAAALLRIERAKEAATAALKEWVEAKGPVRVRDEWFGFYPKSSFKVTDMTGFFAAMQAAGKDPWAILSVNGQKLRKHLGDPAIGETLQRLVVEEKSTYFSHRDKSPG